MTTPLQAMETGQEALHQSAKAIASVCAMGMEIAKERDACLGACRQLLEIAKHRWRSLPTDSPEKIAIKAAYDAITLCEKESKP